MTDPRTPEEILRGLVAPEPPGSLRADALRAARAAMAAVPPPTFWERLFSSRPVRLAWAAAVVLLLVAHLRLTAPRGGVSLAPAPEAEVAALARLPRIDPTLLPPEPAPVTAPRKGTAS